MGGHFGVMIIGLIFTGIGMYVQHQLKSKFKKFSKEVLSSGLNGKEIAEKMLRENGINDVKVVSVQGFLSDHYNPTNKTVNLSPDVYSGRSIAAAAVSAHECGHAIQHATAYSWLTMRSKLVPIVSFGSKYLQWVLLAGIFLISSFPQLLLAGIVMFALTTLFSFITLPVEFDASNRALAWLEKTRLTNGTEHENAKSALNWAAATYVVAALASLATLIQYIMIYMRRR